MWISYLNKINGNALSGYQESNLGEMGDNSVHNGSFIHPLSGSQIIVVRVLGPNGVPKPNSNLGNMCDLDINQ